jgi:hypothetical protein
MLTDQQLIYNALTGVDFDRDQPINFFVNPNDAKLLNKCGFKEFSEGRNFMSINQANELVTKLRATIPTIRSIASQKRLTKFTEEQFIWAFGSEFMYKWRA